MAYLDRFGSEKGKRPVWIDAEGSRGRGNVNTRMGSLHLNPGVMASHTRDLRRGGARLDEVFLHPPWRLGPCSTLSLCTQ